MRSSRVALLACLGALALFGPATAQAVVISGTITDWPESGPFQTIGDGVNNVQMWWSINTYDRGWFYGSQYGLNSDVALAAGVTDISQITDASIYSYTSLYIGPVGDGDYNPSGIGDFVVYRNISSGYYGVLRVDDIHDVIMNPPYGELDGTWWFQTDGTGVFPEPGTFGLVALCGLLVTRRR
jgi:hypothetical protein